MAISGKGDDPFKSAWARSKTRRSRFHLLYENNPLANESVAAWDDFLFDPSISIVEAEASISASSSQNWSSSYTVVSEFGLTESSSNSFESSLILESEFNTTQSSSIYGEGVLFYQSESTIGSQVIVSFESDLSSEAEFLIELQSEVYGQSAVVIEAETVIQSSVSIYGEKVLAIAGIVKNQSNTPIANCPVKLFKASDDTLVDETTSGPLGQYEFIEPAGGPFYAASFSPDNTLAGITVPTLTAA